MGAPFIRGYLAGESENNHQLSREATENLALN
jgi:hypothetical protein